ncbi:MAG: transcription termination factor NusA [Alphaproteobacteria bacterium]
MMYPTPSDILHIAESVAREKEIDREQVLEALELAIQKAGRTKYGQEHDIRAEIDRKSGQISLRRYREVVEVIEFEQSQLTVAEAARYKPDAVIGDVLVDELPPLDFGRIATQTAKQIVLQKVREAERGRQFDEFKDRVGEIVTGIVRRVEFGNLIVDLGRAEAMLRRDHLIPRETYRRGDRVRAYIMDLRPEARGPQIILSRVHSGFMAALFAQEVPEIYEGLIQIKSIARDPGSRAKMIVHTDDPSIDPMGSCVGMRGSRVQAVVNELHGEKIDIIPWDDDVAKLVVRALAPAQVTKVILDEENNRIEAVVVDDQLSQAIGRRGQNVRLAAQLLGVGIDVMTESDESEKRLKDMKEKSSHFKEALDVDDVIAHLLVVEGFNSAEDIADIDPAELEAIEGFDANVAAQLIERAQVWQDKKHQAFLKKRKDMGIEEELITVAGLTPDLVMVLAEQGITTLDALADLAADELVDLLGSQTIRQDEAENVIMAARAHWFEGGDAAVGAA